MKDFFGRTLAIGDTVAICRPGYRDFTRAIVMGFTEKQVKLVYKRHNTTESIIYTDSQGRSYNTTYITYPNNVVKFIDS